METLILTRTKTGPSGTFGTLPLGIHQFHTIELQEDENRPGLSCIPTGMYTCHVAYSPHFDRELYHVLDVPDRSDILIHPANWAGDTRKGMHCDLLGCIGLGMSVGTLDDQDAILGSKVAVGDFMDALCNEDFQLLVVEAFDRVDA